MKNRNFWNKNRGIHFFIFLILSGSGTIVQKAFSGSSNGSINSSVQVGEQTPLINSALQVSWTRSIELRDYMKRFVFPEELISYEIEFPGTFPARHLKLTREDQPIDYQLANVSTDSQGNLKQARVYFRTGLDKGQSHTFTLSYDPGHTSDFEDCATLASVDPVGHTAILHTNYQQVQVPYGEWSPDALFSEVPAPVLKVSHRPDDWVGLGRLYGNLKVERISAGPIEDGNLFLKYRIIYFLEGGRNYQVDLTIRHNEKYVTIDEQLENISPEDKLAFRFSYTQGIDPDARLTVSNHGYNSDETGRWRWCGYYDKEINPDGSLPYHLGQWSPHSATATNAVLFWNDSPEEENAIIFSVYRIEQWKTHLRYVWNSGNAAENLYFYQKNGEKYMQAGLAGTQRHWAISIIHENDEHPITIESQDGSRRFYWKANRDLEGLDMSKWTQKGGGPEVRLVQKLTDFSLDWVKDLVFVWDEDLDARYENPFHGKEEEMTYAQYIKAGGIVGSNNYQFVERSGASYLGGAQTLGRGQPDWLPDYALSRKKWTPEQRQEVRAILIHWISCMMFHDAIHPHISMISGHPNFIIETIYAGIYCKIFPNHPDAPRWKEAFLKMWDEYLTVYLRHADSDHYTLAGRHTENVTCYSRASLRGALDNIRAFRQFDGTDLTQHPRFKEWIRWHMYALVTAAPWGKDDFHTYSPPQGAHAFEVERPNHSEWRDLFLLLVEEIRPGDPRLADNFLWALTRGGQGIRPNLESALFADYGAILRYDFGGPNEAYLNIQQINSWSGIWNNYRLSGSMNYRWGDRGNGSVYYAAQDKIWSWNTPEANGDNFDINELPVFKVGNNGLLGHKTDGVLYNFDAIQFYRANGSSPDYHSRDVMMVRNDYIAIYDNVRDGAEGEFLWANPYWDMPVIHPIAEGAGDNLHIVEPRTSPAYTIEKTPYGSVMQREDTTEYVFMSDRNQSVEQKDISFQGRSAYARKGLLAIFEGSRLRLEDFSLEIKGEGFGASASIRTDGNIQGRISGNGSGEIIITLPEEIKTGNRSVYINGEMIEHQTSNARQIIFKCNSSVKNGYYSTFDIVSSGGTPTPKPDHPSLSFTVSKIYSLQIGFVNAISGLPAEDVKVIFNRNNYITNEQGIISIPELYENDYQLELADNRFEIIENKIIEVRSDTMISIYLTRIPQLALKVINRTNGAPIYRALVNVDDQSYPSNSSGMVDIGKYSLGSVNVSASHNDYFTTLDTMVFNSDTTFTVFMTPKRATVAFRVSDINGPLNKAKVSMSGLQYTSTTGSAFFFLQPARAYYPYSIEMAGYSVVKDTLYLEIDTTVEIMLEKPVSVHSIGFSEFSVSPNPFDSYINVNIQKSCRLYIYDVSGILRYNLMLEPGMNTINTNNFKNGGYILKIVVRDMVYNSFLFK